MENISIVGAGPAGLSAALHLQQRGYNPIIFEKYFKGREKICGGIITPNVREQLEKLGIELNNISKISEVIFTKENKIKYRGDLIKTGLYEVDRREFDLKLQETFIDRGGVILYEEEVLDIDEYTREIITEKGVYEYARLIIATGAEYFLKNKIKKEYQDLKILVNTKQIRNETSRHLYVVDFYGTNKGFQSVVQKENYNSITTGTFIKEERDEFIDKYKTNIEGLVTPDGEQPPRYNSKDIFFIGDAGGYIETYMNLGIGLAMYSGEAIADIIDKNNYKLDEGIRDYLKEMYNIQRNLDKKYILKVFHKNLDNTRLIEYYATKYLLPVGIPKISFREKLEITRELTRFTFNIGQ